MFVKVLEFDTCDLKQAERKLVELLNEGVGNKRPI